MPIYLVFATYNFDDGMPSLTRLEEICTTPEIAEQTIAALKLEDDLDSEYTIEKWFVKQ